MGRLGDGGRVLGEEVERRRGERGVGEEVDGGRGKEGGGRWRERGVGGGAGGHSDGAELRGLGDGLGLGLGGVGDGGLFGRGDLFLALGEVFLGASSEEVEDVLSFLEDPLEN